jgi:hypothetical protein
MARAHAVIGQAQIGAHAAADDNARTVQREPSFVSGTSGEHYEGQRHRAVGCPPVWLLSRLDRVGPEAVERVEAAEV